ncbi:MAG TPA: hypothetical protein VFQ53_10780 [Kofleriaceae bacterium]|nr:hypothetical protein [Kofleriaceae bacterium]
MIKQTSLALAFFASMSAAIAQPAPPAAPPAEPPAPPATDPAPPPTTPPPPTTTEPTPPPPGEPNPPPPPTPPAAPTLSGKYDKGFWIGTDDKAFTLRIGFKNHLRFESTRATEEGSEFQNHFLIVRSRLQLDGNAFATTNRYKLELALGDAGSFGFIRDLYVERRVRPAPVWLRLGQWKEPFNRQELVSDFAGEFNERAITAQFAKGGRSMGFAIHNDYEKSPEGLEWVVGIFNTFAGGADKPDVGTTCTADAATGKITCKTGSPTTVPLDFDPALVARVGWNSGDVKGYSEGDLEGGPLRWGVGLAYKIDFANFGNSDNISHGVEADLMVKVNRLGFEGGVYGMKIAPGDFELGAFVQPGYFVVPKKVQVAGRFAFVPVGDRTSLEIRAAFNWLWEGHAWKWMTDVGMLQLTGENAMGVKDDPDFQIRSMWQLAL